MFHKNYSMAKEIEFLFQTKALTPILLDLSTRPFEKYDYKLYHKKCSGDQC